MVKKDIKYKKPSYKNRRPIINEIFFRLGAGIFKCI